MGVTTYRLHGLRLASELAFPELPREEGAPDVRLSLGPLRPPEDPEGSSRPHRLTPTPDGTWFVWRGVATVRIAAGERIEVDPAPDTEAEALRSALLGPAFTVLLLQRGLHPLHASAVVLGGSAVAFAGVSGSGKSTLALELASRGHVLLADDVVAIDVAAEPPWAHAAFPQLKLDPDLLVRRGRDPDGLPRVGPGEDKRKLGVADSFHGAGAPLARVYLVEDGDAGVVGPLGAREAFFEAARQGHRGSLAARVVGEQAVMDRCSRLAARVPFFRLRRPRALERLGELAERVEEHALA